MKKFPKNLPLTDSNSNNLLNNCEYVIDMSIIKGDGGGTQYTFLEAIYQDSLLILHNEWINKGDLFIFKYTWDKRAQMIMKSIGTIN